MHLYIAAFMADTLLALLVPLMAGVAAAFLYVFYEFGRLAMAAWQRRGSRPGEAGQDLRCFALLHWAACNPSASGDNWNAAARGLLQWPRIAAVAAPVLGLVASAVLTGAPSGMPQSLDFQLVFAPVGFGLLAALAAFVIILVRRRWLDEELAWLHARADHQREREERVAAHCFS